MDTSFLNYFKQQERSSAPFQISDNAAQDQGKQKSHLQPWLCLHPSVCVRATACLHRQRTFPLTNVLRTHPSITLLPPKWRETPPKNMYYLSESTAQAPSLRLASAQFPCWVTTFHPVCGASESAQRLLSRAGGKLWNITCKAVFRLNPPNCHLLWFFLIT